MQKLKSRGIAKEILKKNKEEQTDPMRSRSKKTANDIYSIFGENKCKIANVYPVKISFINKSTYKQTKFPTGRFLLT